MLILALESTARTASVALWKDGEPVAITTHSFTNTHSTTLLPMTQEILRSGGYKTSDIDLLACAIGPGSFTGIRIGAATVQGLAFGTDTPTVGVSSLAALAYNLRGNVGIICPVLSARRSQLYTAVFSSDGEKITRLTEDTVILSPDLGGYLAPYSTEIRFTGDGYAEAHAATASTHIKPTVPTLRIPSAFSVAEAAYDLYYHAPDKSVFTPASLTPIYLRKTQAEQEREERLATAGTQI